MDQQDRTWWDSHIFDLTIDCNKTVEAMFVEACGRHPDIATGDFRLDGEGLIAVEAKVFHVLQREEAISIGWKDSNVEHLLACGVQHSQPGCILSAFGCDRQGMKFSICMLEGCCNIGWADLDGVKHVLMIRKVRKV